MRGRKPKPTFLKLVQGNPGHRPVNRDEPAAPPAIPEPPAYLTPEAVQVWHNEGPLLKDSGLLSNLDRHAFAAYCQAIADIATHAADIVKFGRYMRYPTGAMAKSLPTQSYDAAVKTMRAFAAEFGLTPSSRSRVKVTDDKPVDPFEAYLDGKSTPSR